MKRALINTRLVDKVQHRNKSYIDIYSCKEPELDIDILLFSAPDFIFDFGLEGDSYITAIVPLIRYDNIKPTFFVDSYEYDKDYLKEIIMINYQKISGNDEFIKYHCTKFKF